MIPTDVPRSSARWKAGVGVLVLLSLPPAYFFWARRSRYERETAPADPLPVRSRLVATLRDESTRQSIENLAAFDDTVWVLGSMANEPISRQDSYRYSRVYIPRLNRVRKIREVTEKDRSGVVEALREAFAQAVSGDFAEVAEAKDRQVVEASDGDMLDTPDDYWRRIVIAPAATYLLGELEAHEALPTLVASLEGGGRLPVSRLFLLYTVHRLIGGHPTGGLPPEALARRRDYLAATAFPEPEVSEVPAWDAPLEESDFRNEILKRDVGLERSSRKVRLHLYPSDLDDREDRDGGLRPEMTERIRLAKAFVDAAYPSAGR